MNENEQDWVGLWVQAGITEGVIFLTYSSLISSSDQGMSRLEQLVEWCGQGFDGLIILDEVCSLIHSCFGLILCLWAIPDM